MAEEPPTQVSIRTDDKNAWRYDCIQRAADFYGLNRSNATAFACEVVSSIAGAVESVLERDDLTHNQRQEISELFDRTTRGLEIEVKNKVSVSTDNK